MKIAWFTWILFVLAAMFPPWQLSWIEPISQKQHFSSEFGGFHFWGYVPQLPGKVIAWDGIDDGGKVGVEATAVLWADLYLLEIGILFVVALLVTWSSLRRRAI